MGFTTLMGVTGGEASAPASGTRLGRPTTRLGKALQWSYVLSIGGNTIKAVLTLVVAALLGPHEYGLMALAMVWVALVLVLLQFGPTFAVIQQHDVTEEHVNAAFWATVVASVVCAGLLAATTPLWSAYNGLPELIPICLALTPMVILQSFNVIQDAVLRRRLRMRGIAIRVMVSNLGAGAVGITAAAAGFGVWALVAQQLVWPVLYGSMLWPIAGWRPRRGPILRPLRDLRRTAVQTYTGAVGGYFSTRVDVLLMGTLFIPEIIGLWRFAQRLSELATELVAGGLNVVSLPHLARHGENVSDLEREQARLMYGASLLTFPALGVLAGCAEAVVLFIGDQWALAAAPLRVMCLAAAVMAVATFLGVACSAKQRSDIPAWFSWITVPILAAGIGLSAWLTATTGDQGKLMGVAVATLVVQTVIAAAQGYVVFRRLLGVSPRTTVLITLPGVAAAIAAAGTGAVTYHLVDANLNRFFDLAVSGTASVVVAGVVLLALDRQARVFARQLLARVRRLLES